MGGNDDSDGDDPENGNCEHSSDGDDPENGNSGNENGETGDESARGEADHPIDGTALLKAGALASVPTGRLPALLSRVQADLSPRIDDYRRRYERIDATPQQEAFLVEPDHWDTVGDRLGLSDRERDAVARAHEAAVERAGSATDRREEFDTALEIRTGVVIGVDEE